MTVCPRTVHAPARPHRVAVALAGLTVLLAPGTGPAAGVPVDPGGAPAPPPPASAGAPESVVPVGVWPLDPVPDVVADFDPPDTPYGAGHRGVDLAGRVAQPVRSALPGRVSYAGVLAGRGVVVVDHGSTRTTYQPVAASVAVGDRVGAGDRLGFLELGGSHCAPSACLHWGWIEGETYLDPLLLVGAGPVRLLPLGPGPGSGAAGPAPGAGSPGSTPAQWWAAQARGWAWR